MKTLSAQDSFLKQYIDDHPTRTKRGEIIKKAKTEVDINLDEDELFSKFA